MFFRNSKAARPSMVYMDLANDLGQKTANELRELHTYFSAADEVYRTFRTLYMEDRKELLVKPVVDWVPCSRN
jgi:hypothetical protein